MEQLRERGIPASCTPCISDNYKQDVSCVALKWAAPPTSSAGFLWLYSHGTQTHPRCIWACSASVWYLGQRCLKRHFEPIRFRPELGQWDQTQWLKFLNLLDFIGHRTETFLCAPSAHWGAHAFKAPMQGRLWVTQSHLIVDVLQSAVHINRAPQCPQKLQDVVLAALGAMAMGSRQSKLQSVPHLNGPSFAASFWVEGAAHVPAKGAGVALKWRSIRTAEYLLRGFALK